MYAVVGPSSLWLATPMVSTEGSATSLPTPPRMLLLNSPPAQYYNRRRPDLPQLVAVVRRHGGFQDLPRPELEGRALRDAEHAVPEYRTRAANGGL